MRDAYINLLRHGESVGGYRFPGDGDEPLSSRGRSQVRGVVARLPHPSRLVSSPARRCREPAAELAERLGVALSLDPDLAERDFGEWGGRRATDISDADLSRFFADPAGFTPPGAEPMAAFAARVSRSWSRLRGCADGETLVMTHGGVVRVVLAQVLEIPLPSLGRIEVPFAGMTRIRVPPPPGRPSLVSHGGPG